MLQEDRQNTVLYVPCFAEANKAVMLGCIQYSETWLHGVNLVSQALPPANG